MARRKRSIVAQDLRTPKYKKRVVQDKREKGMRRIFLDEINEGIRKANDACEREFGYSRMEG